MEGAVEISGDLDEVRRCATRIGGRYMGPDRAEECRARNTVAGELVVRLRPRRGVRARLGRLMAGVCSEPANQAAATALGTGGPASREIRGRRGLDVPNCARGAMAMASSAATKSRSVTAMVWMSR